VSATTTHPDLDPDPALSVAFNIPTQFSFLTSFFCLLLSEGTVTSVFKEKKVTKQVKSTFFSIYFAC
jgi:hypothetical protein